MKVERVTDSFVMGGAVAMFQAGFDVDVIKRRGAGGGVKVSRLPFIHLEWRKDSVFNRATNVASMWKFDAICGAMQSDQRPGRSAVARSRPPGAIFR